MSQVAKQDCSTAILGISIAEAHSSTLQKSSWRAACLCVLTTLIASLLGGCTAAERAG